MCRMFLEINLHCVIDRSGLFRDTFVVVYAPDIYILQDEEEKILLHVKYIALQKKFFVICQWQTVKPPYDMWKNAHITSSLLTRL